MRKRVHEHEHHPDYDGLHGIFAAFPVTVENLGAATFLFDPRPRGDGVDRVAGGEPKAWKERLTPASSRPMAAGRPWKIAKGESGGAVEVRGRA